MRRLTSAGRKSAPLNRGSRGDASHPAFAGRTSKTQRRARVGHGRNFAEANSGHRRDNSRRIGERRLAGAIAIDSKRRRPENPARWRAQCRPARKPCARPLERQTFRAGRNATARPRRASGQGLAAHLRNACAAGRADFHRAGLQRTHGQPRRTGGGLPRRESVGGNCRLRLPGRGAGKIGGRRISSSSPARFISWARRWNCSAFHRPATANAA